MHLLLANVGAPGFETGQGMLCDGAEVATRPTSTGDLAAYAKSYEKFSLDTSGITSVLDRVRYPSELRNALEKAEADCCGSQ